MDGLGLDPTVAFVICLFVAGFVQMIKYIKDREWYSALTILVAGIVGGIAGWILGINVLFAICAGFAASGLITVVKRVGDY